MIDEKIKRINELYKKANSEGLTNEEKMEQKRLREEYVKSFRQGMMNTLENVYIVDKDGNKKKVERKGN